MINYNPYQFSIFRIYTGAYLLFIFLTAIPSSAAIWSNEGLVPLSTSNLTYGIFPNLLDHYDSPQQILWFLVLLSLLSLMFSMGVARKWVSVLIWYGWTCLFNRNNLTLNPSIQYIGWLLLACCFIPSGEPWSLSRKNSNWRMPKLIFWGAWILLFTGYFFSGVDKLNSTSWANGSALQKIMESLLARVSDNWLLHLPAGILRILNWLVIAMELACLPLAILSITRKWAWIFSLCIQTGIFLILNIDPIVFGMLTIMVFTFNKEWFNRNLKAKT